MAKFFIALFSLLALAQIASADSEDDCVCKDYTDEEKQQIWEFLDRISREADDEDKSILPGVLSPLVPCGNCLDSARKKRTILPSVTDRDAEADDAFPFKQDSRCPVGYGRIGFRCINLAYLYK